MKQEVSQRWGDGEARNTLSLGEAGAGLVGIASDDEVAIADGGEANRVLVVARVPALKALHQVNARLVHALAIGSKW